MVRNLPGKVKQAFPRRWGGGQFQAGNGIIEEVQGCFCARESRGCPRSRVGSQEPMGSDSGQEDP